MTVFLVIENVHCFHTRISSKIPTQSRVIEHITEAGLGVYQRPKFCFGNLEKPE